MEWKTGIILEILFVFLFLLQILNVKEGAKLSGFQFKILESCANIDENLIFHRTARKTR